MTGKLYLDPDHIPDESVGSILWWRWQLRGLLDQHGVRSNPAVEDEWIVEELEKLIVKGNPVEKTGKRWALCPRCLGRAYQVDGDGPDFEGQGVACPDCASLCNEEAFNLKQIRRVHSLETSRQSSDNGARWTEEEIQRITRWAWAFANNPRLGMDFRALGKNLVLACAEIQRLQKFNKDVFHEHAETIRGVLGEIAELRNALQEVVKDVDAGQGTLGEAYGSRQISASTLELVRKALREIPKRQP